MNLILYIVCAELQQSDVDDDILWSPLGTLVDKKRMLPNEPCPIALLLVEHNTNVIQPSLGNHMKRRSTTTTWSRPHFVARGGGGRPWQRLA